MAKGKANNYFEMFKGMAQVGIEASYALEKMVKEFNPEKMAKLNDKIKEIEHQGDQQKHALMEELASEFMTPIEREDIVEIAQELDDVVDTIEELFQAFYMYNIKELKPYVLDLSEMITKSTVALKACFDELERFRKSDIIKSKIVEVNLLEEMADSVYIKSVRELFLTEKDPVLLHVWTIIYEKLEKTADRIEQVADTLEMIIMKNN